MSHFPHGAFIAIHAAREKQRRDELEEEEMTNYTKDDLDHNWEFKIVRSESGAFRKPDIFQNLLQEEQIAGWELVEKLDDRRVRLKRRKEDRRKDSMLPQGYDPYRTLYGRSAARSALIIGIAMVFTLTGGLIAVSASARDSSGGIEGPLLIAPLIMIFGVITLIALIGAVAFFRRR